MEKRTNSAIHTRRFKNKSIPRKGFGRIEKMYMLWLEKESTIVKIMSKKNVLASVVIIRKYIWRLEIIKHVRKPLSMISIISIKSIPTKLELDRYETKSALIPERQT